MILLLLVIAVGGFLRFYQLGFESVWLDESHSVRVANLSLSAAVRTAAAGQHTPLYFGLLHFWIRIFGDGELALRSLSAMFGIASIPLIYLVGSTLVSRKVGLIASLLSSVSLFHITYSQEARPYILVLLLTLLSFLFFIRILKHGGKLNCAGYLIASVLLVYTHVYGLLTIAVQLFVILLFWTRYKPHRLKLLVCGLAMVVAMVPLVLLMRRVTMSVIEHGFWVSEPSLTSIYNTLGTFAGYETLLLLAFFCLVVIAPFSIRKTGGTWAMKQPIESLSGMRWEATIGSIEEITLLVAWLALPITASFVLSKITTPTYVIKYFIGSSPALYLLVAMGISNLKVRRLAYPVLLVVALLTMPHLVDYYANEQKEQWRDAAAFVGSNTDERDVLVFCASYAQGPFDYYFRQQQQGPLDEYGIGKQVEDRQAIADFVTEATSEKERLWLIISHAPADAPVRGYLRDTYGDESLALEREFIGIRIFLFDVSSTDGPADSP